MGLNLNNSDLGDFCPLCFPTGKTPKYVMASFSGIVKTIHWHTGMRQPPNGTIKLENNGGCGWWGINHLGACSYDTAEGSSIVSLNVGGPLPIAFVGSSLTPCVFGFGNDLTEAGGSAYERGGCQLAWV